MRAVVLWITLLTIDFVQQCAVGNLGDRLGFWRGSFGGEKAVTVPFFFYRQIIA